MEYMNYWEGIKKGEFEGKLESQKKFLRKRLQKKFGQLPDWVQDKLEKAEHTKYVLWFPSIMRKDTLEGVFAL